MQIKRFTTCLYYVSACVWSRYLPILMLPLNRQLLLIINLNLCSQVFWFWKVLILHRNQKGFLLSSVYKHLKAFQSIYICMYKKWKGHLIEENQQWASSSFLQNNHIQRMNEDICCVQRQRGKEKQLQMNGKMMSLIDSMMNILWALHSK